MDSFQITNNIRVEKQNAILKHRKLRKVAILFRLIEICVALVVLSRFSTHLPLVVKNSSVYFKDLTVFLGSPRFVFIIGNLIVITLFAKSGQFSTQDYTKKDSINDIYEEFVKKSEKTQDSDGFEDAISDETHISLETKNFRRSQSENINYVSSQKSCRALRRSGTEKNMKSTNSGEKQLVKNSCPEDEMSNEEFRRTIEAFIARQQKFRREEEYYVI